jgi:Rrf2 family protein
MRITYKGDYALKAVMELALHHGNKVVTIQDMASRLNIPIKFLEQVLLDLKKGGFVESRRGKEGGYLLAKHPSQIKLGQVVRFIDGPIEPIACIEKGYTGCTDIHRCVLRKVWDEVGKATSQIIDNVTFEDLVGEIKEKEGALVYSI